MAAITPVEGEALLSAPYDMQDPSAPAPTHPRAQYVPPVVDHSIFGGPAQAPRDELDALFDDDDDFQAPAPVIQRIHPYRSPGTTPSDEIVDAQLAVERQAERLRTQPAPFRQRIHPYQSPEITPLDAATDTQLAAERRAGRLRAEEDGTAQAGGLGIDEEIQQRKKRAPIAKLDYDRLMGEKGIPKLRRISKERLKFKGKGHEFSDVARMLNVYQLWLDDMFPKAKFADGLALIEKVGHQKRMQVMRREWINESKPKPRFDDSDKSDDEEPTNIFPTEAVAPRGQRSPDDDDLYAGPDADSLFVPDNRAPPVAAAVRQALDADEPEEDDLDMLLAEHSAQQATQPPPPPSNNRDHFEDEFADDMEAMAGMDWN